MLYPIRVNKQWGYIDQHGSVRIAPTYSYCSEYSEELAIVNFDNGTGIIDESGKLLAELPYDSILPFKEGRARFRMKDGPFGFIDTSGKIIVPAQFEQAQLDYDEGLVIAARDKIDCILDLEGRVVHTCPRRSMQSSFSGGLAAKADSERLVGFIDKNFEWHLRPQYLDAGIFSENLAYVNLPSQQGAYIDNFGTVVFKGKFVIGQGFSEGVAVAFVGPNYAFFDRSGEMLFGRTFLSLGAFFEGFASVEFEPGKIGYIDRSGKTVIDPIFEMAHPFRNGIAEVSMPGDYSPSYIDKNGTFIWRHGAEQ